MSSLESAPVKAKKPLNPTMLTIAAVLLIVLALLFLATPILRLTGGSARGGNFPRQFNGQTFPGNRNGTGNGFQNPGGNGTGNGFQNPGGNGTGNGFRNPGGTTTTRPFGANRTLLSLGFLQGTTSLIIYGFALLISLAAVIGMLSLKGWGKILGIIMAVVYLLLSLVSFLPTLLLGRFGFSNPVSLILDILHLVLAIGVIIFALLPAKKAALPTVVTPPPAATA
jgi:hypothetical protein